MIFTKCQFFSFIEQHVAYPVASDCYVPDPSCLSTVPNFVVSSANVADQIVGELKNE
jgi:hypothetical protein